MADEEEDGRSRTPRSAQLPQHGFAAIRELVQALADLAAPASKERIAGQLGISAKGRFTSKLAAAKYYGFIEAAENARWQLTDRGRGFLTGEADERLRAMRQGVMRTNYGPIIFSFRSHEPKETAIAGRLQDDVNVPEASASAVAKILVSVSKEAELIDENGRFDPTAIEDTKAELEAAGDEPARVVLPAEPKSSEARVSKTPAGAPSKQTNGKSRETGGATGKGDGECAPLATAPVQVVVNVDASKLGPQEIAALVRALREPTPKDT